MNIIFFGTPEFVVPILEQLHTTHTVVAVVTTPDAPIGRKKIVTPTAVKLAAQKLGIKALTPEKLDDMFERELMDLHPDLFIVASYGKIIPQDILEIAPFGGINVHPSKLPELRGTSPIQEALIEGRKDTGLSLIKMDSKMDHGPILKQVPFTISEKDTFESLAFKMFQLAAELLPQVITDLRNGKIELREQDHEKATFTKRHLSKEDGYFAIDNPPSKEQLDRMVRAFYPWPGVWTRWNGKIVKFYPEGKIQMEGKNIVKRNEFFNGYPETREFFENLL